MACRCLTCDEPLDAASCMYERATDYMGEPLKSMSNARITQLYAGAWDANVPDRKTLLHERRRRSV